MKIFFPIGDVLRKINYHLGLIRVLFSIIWPTYQNRLFVIVYNLIFRGSFQSVNMADGRHCSVMVLTCYVCADIELYES